MLTPPPNPEGGGAGVIHDPLFIVATKPKASSRLGLVRRKNKNLTRFIPSRMTNNISLEDYHPVSVVLV